MDEAQADDERSVEITDTTTLPGIVEVPEGWTPTWDVRRERSGVPVRVRRWQAQAPRTLGGEHVTVVVDEAAGALISYRHAVLSQAMVDAVRRGDDLLPSRGESTAIAKQVIADVDRGAAVTNREMRVEVQSREWRAADGRQVSVPVLWHKHVSARGGFGWVAVGPGGIVIEYERDAQWDFVRFRRGSEQWDFDPWVAAREGTGPQLDPPNALA